MRNRMTISTAVLCMTMLLSACGGSGEDTAHLSEPAVTPIEIEQDSITISSDLKHIFKADDNTVYLKGGEESTETVSKEEFAELLDSRKNSGMFLGIETKNGVVTTAELSAQ